MSKIGIFVDGANIFYGLKGKRIDFKHFLQFMRIIDHIVIFMVLIGLPGLSGVRSTGFTVNNYFSGQKCLLSGQSGPHLFHNDFIDFFLF